MTRSAIGPLAGVAQLPERSISNREVAGEIPAPRSIHPWPRPRRTPTADVFAIVVFGLLAAVGVSVIALAGYTGLVVWRGFL